MLKLESVSVAFPAAGGGIRPVDGVSLEVGETERLVFSSAKAQGKNVFGLTVYIQESCLLKAARAFLVYKAVEERAEIMNVIDPEIGAKLTKIMNPGS